jgi:sodium transport system permease protein
VAEALFCGVIILLIRFFLSFAVDIPNTFGEFAAQQVISQLATFVGPALIMAIILTRNPRQTLSLRIPAWWTMPAALMLVFAIHPIAKLLQVIIQSLYPTPNAIPEQLKQVLENSPNLWSMVFVMALTPAICEELAFRGFILSGLRHLGHKWRAIVLSSVMFGFTHLILQQSVSASIVGVVVGYLVVQSGSIFPAVLFHFGNNALMLAMGHYYNHPKTREHFGPYIQPLANDDFIYKWWVFGFGAIMAGWLLVKFSDLSYRKSDEEAIEEAIERRTVEVNA